MGQSYRWLDPPVEHVQHHCWTSYLPTALQELELYHAWNLRQPTSVLFRHGNRQPHNRWRYHCAAYALPISAATRYRQKGTLYGLTGHWHWVRKCFLARPVVVNTDVE